MPIIRNTQTPLFELPGLSVRGFASPKRGAKETAVWKVQLQPGNPGLEHIVTREEIFVATQGAAVATLEGIEHEFEQGDVLIVPAGTRFSLANPSPAPFEAFVAFPVGGQAVTRDGTFTPLPSIATAPHPVAMALGDVDGDGRLDVALVHPTEGTAWVARGKGDGTFATGTAWPMGRIPYGVALADVNGDGRADLVVSAAADDSVGVRLGELPMNPEAVWKKLCEKKSPSS